MIRKAIKTLTFKRITVELLWTPGRAGLQGNEKANQLAKEGAEEARSMPEETRSVSIRDIKTTRPVLQDGSQDARMPVQEYSTMNMSHR